LVLVEVLQQAALILLFIQSQQLAAVKEEAFELQGCRAALAVGLVATMVILGLFMEAVERRGKVIMVVVQLEGKTLLRVQLAVAVVVARVVKALVDTL
jgi:hypothetical protein